MPFNSSGEYVRVHNWKADRDAGKKILADRMDQEMDSTASAINDLVSNNVNHKGPAKGVSGTAANPAFTFADDLDTGVYREAADSLGFSAGGTKRASVSSTGLDVAGAVKSVSGTAANPAFTFADDLDTGVYREAADSLGFSAGGTKRASVSSTGLDVAGAVKATEADIAGKMKAASAELSGNMSVNGFTAIGDVTIDWAKANDGSGSGLDADKLDGQEGSFYQNSSNQASGVLPPERLKGQYPISITGTAASSGVSVASLATKSATVGDIVQVSDRAYGHFKAVADAGQADGRGHIQGNGVVWSVFSPTGELRLEHFGAVGATADDNLLLHAAVAMGGPIILDGPLYKFRADDAANNPCKFTDGNISIRASAHTEIRNAQTGGVKSATLRFEGSEGASVSVTRVGTGAVGLTKNLTVATTTGLAVGDWCLLREAANSIVDPDPVFPSNPNQDVSYWEYVRIDAISGNSITAQQYLINTWNKPHYGGKGNADVAVKAITLTKVNLGPQVDIQGGIWTGGGTGGGALSAKYCRKPHFKEISAKGFSDSEVDVMGSASVTFEYNIEPKLLGLDATNTLFTAMHHRNQSGIYGNVQGNRTGTTVGGGMVFNGEISSKAYAINQYAPGRYNGDCFAMGEGCRYNVFDFKSNGAHCYTLTIHFGSEYNRVWVSENSGVTAVVSLSGTHNWVSIMSAGHPGNALTMQGDHNVVELDVFTDSVSVLFNSNHIGNKVTGKARTTTPGAVVVQFGDMVDTKVHLDIGDGIHNYASGVRENFTNDIDLKGTGSNSYQRRRVYPNRSHWVFDNYFSVSSQLRFLKIPGGVNDVDGLTDLVAHPGRSGHCYKISLQLNSLISGACSEYKFITLANEWALHWQSDTSVVGKGGGAESLMPRIGVSRDRKKLEVYNNHSSNIECHMLVEKF